MFVVDVVKGESRVGIVVDRKQVAAVSVWVRLGGTFLASLSELEFPSTALLYSCIGDIIADTISIDPSF